VPPVISHALCGLWDRCSQGSKGQAPPVSHRSRWYSEWRKTLYSNEKLKLMLGWSPRISTDEGLRRYFNSCQQGERHA
jgi:hypothetical protein